MLYKATHKQKKIIKLAPDALVRINGSSRVTICPNPDCQASINLSKYITNISSSLANNTTIGNAQFNIAMPRHGDDGIYMVRGGKVHGIYLMDEVEIFIKGRFLSLDNKYKYHKVFWGVISNISESYSGGVQNISVSCESMLKWLQLMKTNENPAILAYEDTTSRIGVESQLITGKVYANKNPYEIIYSLVKLSAGNMVIPTGLDSETQSINEGLSKEQRSLIPVGNGAIIGAQDIQLLNKWRDKFASIKSSLKMFGTSEESFIDNNDAKQTEASTKEKSVNAGGKTRNTPIQIFYNSRALMDFKPFFKPENAGEIDPFKSTYKNNLEIASEVKLMTGFEFYLDTTGDIIFKPPFWNVDTRKNPVFVIKDEDIVSWDFQESDETIVTRMEITGSFDQWLNPDSDLVPRGIFTNYNLARQFGMRTEQQSMRFFTTSAMCYYYAINEMDRINSGRYKASLTIIGRPELRLGLPVYIESRDIFGYLDNISHNFTFGGPYQTQIHISAIRKKYLGEDPMLGGFEFEKQKDSFMAYKYKGDPVMLVYQDASDKSNEFIRSINPKYRNQNKTIAETQSKQATVAAEKLQEHSRDLLRTNRAGIYKEVSLRSDEAQKILKEFDFAKEKENKDSYLDFLQKAIPVSDEEGYELIGIFENGRSLYLDDDGILKKKGRSFSEILSNTLNKVTNKKQTFDAPTLTTVKIKNDPTDNANYLQSYFDTPDETTNTAKEIKNYYADKSLELAKLNPKMDRTRKEGCSCYDSAITGVSLRDTVSSGNKQRIIAKVNTK